MKEGNLKLNIQVQKVDIIFLTDIHSNRQKLEKLSEHIKANSLHFDYCFVGGDIVNCDHNNKTHSEEKQQETCNEILLFLHDLFQCKIIYIPGNHDPQSFIDCTSHVSPDIINIHKKEFVLEMGLSVVGLGGSTPAYNDVEFKKKVWEGYPYQNQQEYEKDVDAVFKPDTLSTSKIFLTHTGPALSSTTLDRHGKQVPIFAGSKALDKVQSDEKLIIHLHGHVHGGAKYDVFNGKPIVNPGALAHGQYAIIKLIRKEKTWQLAKTSFLNLL